MKALVLAAPGKLEIRDEPDPDIGDREVLVRVRACTIGRCDLDMYTGVRQWNGTPPHRFGQEVVGIVESTGATVTQYARGDRVLIRTTQTGFAEYCSADADHLMQLPGFIGFEEGAIAQLFPAVVRGVSKSDPMDKTVFVSGGGSVGMLCAQVARALGAAKIIVADLHEMRLRRIMHLTADVVINASTEDVGRRMEEETDGRGAEICMECSGAEASFRNCEAGLRNNGSLVVVGTHLQPVPLNLINWSERSLHLIMAHEQEDETPDLLQQGLRLVEMGAVTLRPLLTHVFPLHRASEAFDLLRNDPARTIKVALVP